MQNNSLRVHSGGSLKGILFLCITLAKQSFLWIPAQSHQSLAACGPWTADCLGGFHRSPVAKPQSNDMCFHVKSLQKSPVTPEKVVRFCCKCKKWKKKSQEVFEQAAVIPLLGWNSSRKYVELQFFNWPLGDVSKKCFKALTLQHN